MKKQATKRQLDSLKKIYDAFILFLDEYDRTEGFNDYCPDFSKITEEDKRREAKEKFYKELQKKRDKVALVYTQELVVIHQMDFEDLEKMIYEDLPNLYVDQLEPKRRKNALVRSDNTWVEVPYSIASEYVLDMLNGFMFQYF